MYMSEKAKKEGKKKEWGKEYRIDDGAIGDDHRQFVQYNTVLSWKRREEAGINRYRLTSFLKRRNCCAARKQHTHTHTQLWNSWNRRPEGPKASYSPHKKPTHSPNLPLAIRCILLSIVFQVPMHYTIILETLFWVCVCHVFLKESTPLIQRVGPKKKASDTLNPLHYTEYNHVV